MPSARAATPSGLSQSTLASCQHRIAIAWRAIFPLAHQHEWEDGWAFANCVEVTIPTGGRRAVSWQVMQFCVGCDETRRRQLTRVEYDCWIDCLLESFEEGDEHVYVEDLPVAAEAVLRLTWRADGGLRVHSPTHLGLVLSHSRPDLVMADVLPVLAVMGFAASADTLPQGQDAQQGLAGTESGAVGGVGNADGIETPSPSSSPAAGR